ncbi:unnamed protein product [Victoria cruziana]
MPATRILVSTLQIIPGDLSGEDHEMYNHGSPGSGRTVPLITDYVYRTSRRFRVVSNLFKRSDFRKTPALGCTKKKSSLSNLHQSQKKDIRGSWRKKTAFESSEPKRITGRCLIPFVHFSTSG